MNCKWQYRYCIIIMIFWTTFTNYMLRTNMNVSIVKMVKTKGRTKIPACLRTQNKTETPKQNKTEDKTKKFDWDEIEQGYILSAYFYGYLASMIFAGIASEWFGAWNVIFYTNLISIFLTTLTPLSTYGGLIGIVINRTVLGFFGGFAYPACNKIIGKWAPPKEKGKFMAAMLGNTIGIVVTSNIVGIITDVWGWPWGFYVCAAVMGIYTVFFFFFVANSPGQSRCTSEEEREFIQQAQEGQVAKKKQMAPIWQMLKSVPLWVAAIGQLGSLWDLNLVMTYGPKLMSQTYGFNLKASAFLAALPYVARMITGIIFGVAGDALRARNFLGNITRLRKFFILFSHILPSFCFFLILAAGCQTYITVSLLVLNMGFNGATVSSILVNPVDLSPNFAATCFSFMNFIGMLSGIAAPQITGAINYAYDTELIASWIIFALGGSVQIVTGILFILFGSAEIQPWNEIKETDETTT